MIVQKYLKNHLDGFQRFKSQKAVKPQTFTFSSKPKEKRRSHTCHLESWDP